MVYVGSSKLVGEVIGVESDKTTIQVYEDTAGIYPHEAVISTGLPLSIELGPGLIGGIFDGVGKPLNILSAQAGAFIPKGLSVPTLDCEKEWETVISCKTGDIVCGGEVIAECRETPAIKHSILVPPNIDGKIVFAAESGRYKVNDCIARLLSNDGQTHEITLSQRWPIRTPRPVGARLPLSIPLITGQRNIDTMFPIAKGGTAAIPGGFGTGKTVIQHQLAKWADADIIIYVGCGERGNEMTQALSEFSELKDPKTGRPLIERTILIANTSNMPVAAREASIYTGITIAEYYRDMGLHVAMMADSTSRWAEALREISGRLEEMPADEGYPAYLPSRLSEFYERACYCKTLCGKEGSVSVIGAVSPQGSDFSEPVTQNTKRFTCCFWGLDKALAYARHFPSINWNNSYSEYLSALTPWYEQNVSPDFMALRARITSLLAEENRLLEIVKLIGSEVLPEDQKLVLAVAEVIRVGFLQQDALDPDDSFVPVKKHLKMMQAILYLYDKASSLIAEKIPVSSLTSTGIFERLKRMKFEIKNDELEAFDRLNEEIDSVIAGIE